MYEHLTNKNPEVSSPSSVKVFSPSKNIPVEAPKTKEVLPENILARVGDWSLTADEFKDKLKKLKDILPEFDPADINSKKLILEEIVRQELLVKDAEKSCENLQPYPRFLSVGLRQTFQHP